jgi:hypothetical protein
MADVGSFGELTARVCRAAAEQFEAQVRLEAQLRLRDPRLRRLGLEDAHE